MAKKVNILDKLRDFDSQVQKERDNFNNKENEGLYTVAQFRKDNNIQNTDSLITENSQSNEMRR